MRPFLCLDGTYCPFFDLLLVVEGWCIAIAMHPRHSLLKRMYSSEIHGTDVQNSRLYIITLVDILRHVRLRQAICGRTGR